MGGLVPLPGEREVLRSHPSPLGWLPRYALALLPAAWGGLLWLLFRSASWASAPRPASLVHFVAVAGLGAGGLLLAAARRDRLPLALAIAIGLAASILAVALRAQPTDALPLAYALAAVPLLAWAELGRLGTHHHVTNLRLVVRTTFPRRGEQAERHAELADIDVRQGILGRLADVGTLLPVATPPPPRPLRLVGVRPLRRVLRLVEVLVRQATATDYLRERQGLERQQAEALAALQRR
jgi:hypothetical protein